MQKWPVANGTVGAHPALIGALAQVVEEILQRARQAAS